MLCTSIVSGIDADPSPLTCCDGYGYKNLYGDYHPPVLTLTDRQFFSTIHPGWLRHDIAEIIKMACVKDYSMFCLLEDVGIQLVTDQFGTMAEDTDLEFARKYDLIIAKAMEGYVRSEYVNLWGRISADRTRSDTPGRRVTSYWRACCTVTPWPPEWVTARTCRTSRAGSARMRWTA